VSKEDCKKYGNTNVSSEKIRDIKLLMLCFEEEHIETIDKA
jgi:hypothetical protein